MTEISDDEALSRWLDSMQGTQVTMDRIIVPTRGAKNVGALLDEVGGDMAFDREPANYYKLLRELAPRELTGGPKRG